MRSGQVKSGDKRGNYSSKYKTEEEKLTAQKESQRQYYIRKKNKKECENNMAAFDLAAEQPIIYKDEKIRALNKQIRIHKKRHLDLKKIYESLEEDNTLLKEHIKILTETNDNLVKINDELTKNNKSVHKENKGRAPRFNMSKTNSSKFYVEEVSESSYNDEELKADVPPPTEEEIKDYEKRKPYFKNDKDYDLEIENILSERDQKIGKELMKKEIEEELKKKALKKAKK
jgi:hypothetical protein